MSCVQLANRGANFPDISAGDSVCGIVIVGMVFCEILTHVSGCHCGQMLEELNISALNNRFYLLISSYRLLTFLRKKNPWEIRTSQLVVSGVAANTFTCPSVSMDSLFGSNEVVISGRNERHICCNGHNRSAKGY